MNSPVPAVSSPPPPSNAAYPTTSGARGKFLALFLNATACYLLTYQVVNLGYQAAIIWAARRANVPGVWGVSGVSFELGDSGWQRTMVLDVYSSGPLLALLLGGLAGGLFWRRRHRRGVGKLLLLWLVLHASNTLFGGLLADSVTQSGSWYVPNWLLGAGTWPSAVLGILMALIQIALGFGAAIPFLLAQDSHTMLEFRRRPQLVLCSIAGPWLAGSLLLALSKLPHLSMNESLHYATMGLLLVPLAIGCQQEFFSERELLPYPTRVAWGLVVLALLALLAWRLALGTPVTFQ